MGSIPTPGSLSSGQTDVVDVTDEWLDMVCAELQPWESEAARAGAAELVTGTPAKWVAALRRAAGRTPRREWDWYEPMMSQVVTMPGGQEDLAAAARSDDAFLEFGAETLGALWCIEALGVAEVARRYLEYVPDDRRFGLWLHLAVCDGVVELINPLPIELRWQLVMAALDACPDDEVELCSLGDGPFDMLVSEPGMAERFYRERDVNPKLQRLFAAMRRELTRDGHTNSWWLPEVEAQIRAET